MRESEGECVVCAGEKESDDAHVRQLECKQYWSVTVQTRPTLREKIA